MKLPELLAGRRSLALAVAGLLVLLAAYVAFRTTLVLTVSSATFTAFVSLIGTALTAFFWIIDRRDRLKSQQDLETRSSKDRETAAFQRRADVHPQLEFEASAEDAGEGYKRNFVRLVNHGPGIAASLGISIVGLTQADVGQTVTDPAWSADAPAGSRKYVSDYKRSGLAPGRDNGILLYADSDASAVGGGRLPLGPADISGCRIVRLRVEFTDTDGNQVEPISCLLDRAGGFYTLWGTTRRWVEGFALRG